MRFNIANCGDPALPELLSNCLEKASRRSA
jgi:hypothetical protein